MISGILRITGALSERTDEDDEGYDGTGVDGRRRGLRGVEGYGRLEWGGMNLIGG